MSFELNLKYKSPHVRNRNIFLTLKHLPAHPCSFNCQTLMCGSLEGNIVHLRFKVCKFAGSDRKSDKENRSYSEQGDGGMRLHAGSKRVRMLE